MDLTEKDTLDLNINFEPLKRFKYVSQLPANQKLMTIAIIHHNCWIRCGIVTISCISLSNSIKTIFGVPVSTKNAGIAFFLHASMNAC